MSDSEKNEENTPPIYILLPICIEANTDVFFNILKSVVHHERMHGTNFIISGMTGETFDVDTNDISDDWRNLTSDSRQRRQSKLLGCWAARHYPLICKKLIGAAWKPPKTFNVRVNGSKEMTEEEIDSIVSKKMRLRIIELNVCKGTLVKLKYFVQAPMGIARVNMTPLPSSKMRAFDIKSENLGSCWQALKLGGFPSNLEQQMNSIVTLKVPHPSIVTSQVTINRHRAVHRDGDQPTVETRNSTSTRLSNPIMLPTAIPTAKRTRCVSPSNSTTTFMHDESSFDALRVEVFEIRKDIRDLTKYLEPNAGEHGIQLANSSERFHLAVFKQKDAEIYELTKSLRRLENKNELLEDDKTKLSGEIEAKSNLISTLQNAVEVNSKLCGKLEEASNVMVQKLSDADKLKIVMSETSDKLQEELTVVKNRLAYFDSDFQCEKQDLMRKLTAADQLNCDLTDKDRKLREELDVAKNNSLKMEFDFQYQLQDLDRKLSASDQVNIELTESNKKLQEDLNAAKNHFVNMESYLQCQIQELVDKSFAADRKNIDLTDTNTKLQEEMNTARDHSAKMESNLQHRIKDLVHKLSASDQINIDFTGTNRKLQHELNATKIKLCENEKMSETINNLKVRANNLVKEFQIRVEASEKMNAQLANENKKLQEQLNAIKGKELFQLNSLLHNRPETLIHTERMEALDIHNGYDQGESKKEKNQCSGGPGDNYEKKLPEPVKSGEGVTVDPNSGALDYNQELSEEDFVSDDRSAMSTCVETIKNRLDEISTSQKHQIVPGNLLPSRCGRIRTSTKRYH